MLEPRDRFDDDDDLFLDTAETGCAAFVREQLACTPWWAISLSLHLFVCLVIAPLFESPPAKRIASIKMDISVEQVEDAPLPEPTQDVDPARIPVDAPKDVEDPLSTDQPSSQTNESDDNEPYDQMKGSPDCKSDVQMNERWNNDALGAGACAGGMFGGRLGGNENKIGTGTGCPSKGTQDAVDAGLRWLRAHQDADGKWDGDGFMKHDPPTDVCTGASTMSWVDPGLTGLATLAFLGAGNTHRYGKFKDVVRKAVQYMMKVQSADGLVGGQRGHYMYGHSICALALTEAYGMTKSGLVKLAAQKSIEYLVKARNPGLSWRYSERCGDNDISVAGWCVMALKSARAAELAVEGLDEAFKQTAAWMESITDDEYGVSGYKSRPPRGWQGPTSSRFNDADLGVNTSLTFAPNHTPTAIATMCRVFYGYPRNDARLNNGATIVSQMPPVWDEGGKGKPSKVDFYYWYYSTLAMFQIGGEHWKQWDRHIKGALVQHQKKDGSAKGSWDPVDAWGFAGGRVYATATNVLTLEIYYRYARVFH